MHLTSQQRRETVTGAAQDAAAETTESLQRTVDRLRKLQSCLIGMSAKDLDGSLRTMLEAAMEGTRAVGGTITVLDEEDITHQTQLGVDPAVWEAAFNVPAVVKDTPPLSAFGSSLLDLPFRSTHILLRALKAELRPIGLLKLMADPAGTGFSAEDREFVEALVEHASVLVYNGMLFEEAQSGRKALQKAYAELQQKQEQLVRSEKLAAIGQLAAKVSHEINNPLTAVSGCTQLIRRRMETATDLEQFKAYLSRTLEMIGKETERCARITGDLLDYSRHKVSRAEETCLRSVLVHALELIQYKCPGCVEVSAEFDPNVPALNADPQRLTQVFLNLLTNASEAMPDGGSLRVTTSLMEGSEASVVKVEITDTGEGIDAEIAGKLFEPFYTTKATGTGLGLSVCKDIVEQHGGTLKLSPAEGGGTVATVILPFQPSERFSLSQPYTRDQA